MSTDQEKLAAKNIKGAFVRSATAFHDIIHPPDTPNVKYTASKGRYHLYYSAACPWCHRVLVTLALKGLDESVISVSNVEPLLSNMGKPEYIGWTFGDKYPDHLHKESKSVWDVYRIHDPQYTNSKLTVPIVFDKQTQKVVSNESAEIITFLNSAFNAFAKRPELDLDPSDANVQRIMSKWNDVIYPCLNDGVYRCGFAKSQDAYNDTIEKMFVALDSLEQHLDSNRYICGDAFTLSDVRAWVTLIRFDVIYVTHFKCNWKMLSVHYANIWNYTREILQMEGVAATWDLAYTKGHYYGSHRMVNTQGIVPKGPCLNFDEPHTRDKKKYAAVKEVDEQKENN